MVECRDRVQRALDSLAPGSDFSPRLKMQLQIALGVVLQHTTGPMQRTEADLAEALEIAEDLKDEGNQLLALWALWFYRMNMGEARTAHRLAEQFSVVAQRSVNAANALFGDRLLGNSLHFVGDQTAARHTFEHLLELYVKPSDQLQSIWFLYDLRVSVQLVLARVLLLQGSVNQATERARSSLADAESSSHTLSVCYAHAWGIYPIALTTGDYAAAEQSVAI